MLRGSKLSIDISALAMGKLASSDIRAHTSGNCDSHLTPSTPILLLAAYKAQVRFVH
jgi:hypothetical protein